MLDMYLVLPMSSFSVDVVLENIEKRKELLNNYNIYHPMIGKGFLKNDMILTQKDNICPIINDHHIFELSKWMVKKSDVVFADFTNAEKASIGSSMELAWACDYGKYVVSVLQENNPHQHAFILQASDIVFDNVDEAIYYLNKFSSYQM